MAVQIFDENGISDFVDGASQSGFVDQDGDFFATSDGGDPPPEPPPSGSTILMPQICMSFLILIGGIATYYLDK